MGAKRLDQYTGVLSLEQVAAGMNAALRNAARLAEDAERLDAGAWVGPGRAELDDPVHQRRARQATPR